MEGGGLSQWIFQSLYPARFYCLALNHGREHKIRQFAVMTRRRMLTLVDRGFLCICLYYIHTYIMTIRVSYTIPHVLIRTLLTVNSGVPPFLGFIRVFYARYRRMTTLMVWRSFPPEEGEQPTLRLFFTPSTIGKDHHNQSRTTEVLYPHHKTSWTMKVGQ